MAETKDYSSTLLETAIRNDNPIWKHHVQNLKTGNQVHNEDGSVSTVRTVIMGDGVNEYLIPTVWEGKILSNEEAWDKAMHSGVRWPRASAGEKGVASLEALDKLLHKDMHADGYAQGGTVTNTEQKMNKVFAEGGVNTTDKTKDPVSGNEVPPGSLPEEVRDDVPAKLSGGEYVVPADVLRYYGVSFFEKLRAKAKAGLEEMDSQGRIGGGPSDGEEEDLPFSVDELQAEDMPDDMHMATGGLTTKQEEQQMLAAQPTFNPAQWTYGGGVTPYSPPVYNPLVGTPAANQTPTTPAKTASNNQGRAGVDYGAQGDTKTSAAGSQSQGALVGGDWAKDLNFSDPKSVMEWADNKSSSSMLGSAAKVGGALVGGPLVAGAIGAASLGNRAAQIRAAARLAADEGNDALSKQLSDKADKMLDGGLVKDIISSFATGDNYYKAAVAAKSSGSPKPTTAGFKTTSTGQGGAGTGSNRDVGYTTTGTTSGGGFATAKATGSTAPSSSPTPQARPTTPSTRTSSSTTATHGGGRAKGGLITKPKKKS